MKLKNTLAFFLIILLMMLLMSCTQSKQKSYISLEDVSSIQLISGGDFKVVLTHENNPKEFEEFIKSYNEGKPYNNQILGMSPKTQITIELKNGEKILDKQK